MKFLLLFLITTPVLAKPLVLLSYYDPFQGASFNNSQKVAALVESELKTSAVQIKQCPLNTIFDRAYGQLERCLKNLGQRPDMVLGLGETGCKLKIETIAQNKDLSRGTDNAGERRHGTEIVPNGPSHISLRYPLPQMYCSLSSKERKSLIVSKSAGTFVCNNTAYLMAHYYPETQFGFIHVPTHKCANLSESNKKNASILARMIQEAAGFLTSDYSGPLPHPNNGKRLPLKKAELTLLRKEFKKDNKCLYEFFSRAKGIDEKKRKSWF